MENLLAVAHYTLLQHIRHRVYFAIILFSAILLGAGLVISSLAVEQQMRMIFDVGLAGLEFLSLIAVIFLTVNIVLEEMESRTLYLVLSHPIKRWQYIVGRYAGTLTALLSGMVIMAVLHVASLYAHGWSFQTFYTVALLSSMAKIAVVGALALLISLITTSTASSMMLTGFLWVLGHFTEEMTYMGDKSDNPLVKAFIEFLSYVTPNFAYFNYRDFFNAPMSPPLAWFGWMTVYAAGYVAISLFLASWLFSKKEF